jgi:hypothetical protein
LIYIDKKPYCFDILKEVAGARKRIARLTGGMGDDGSPLNTSSIDLNGGTNCPDFQQLSGKVASYSWREVLTNFGLRT